MKKRKLWAVAATVAAVSSMVGVTAFAATASNSTTTSTTAATSGTSTQSANHHQWQGHGRGVDFTNNTALLSLLKLDATTLKSDLQSGKTLADIAKAQGVTEQQVIDVLVNARTQEMNQLVSSGKITQAQATKMQANLPTMVKAQVEGQFKGGPGRGGHGGPRGGFGFGFGKDDTALLTLLKVDAATFKQDLQSGKSIADIAAANNVSEQQVIDLLVNNETTHIKQAVTDGKMTQQEADQKTANLPAEVKKMVESKHTGPKDGHRGGRHGHADNGSNTNSNNTTGSTGNTTGSGNATGTNQ